MATVVDPVRREHVAAFLEDLLARKSPATARSRFRAGQAFFRWALEVGEVKASPIANMKPARLPEAPPPALREAELRRLIETTERDHSYNGRRDAAIIRLFMDTGNRRGELLGLEAAEVDLDTGLAKVTSKRSRTRTSWSRRPLSAPRPCPVPCPGACTLPPTPHHVVPIDAPGEHYAPTTCRCAPSHRFSRNLQPVQEVEELANHRTAHRRRHRET